MLLAFMLVLYVAYCLTPAVDTPYFWLDSDGVLRCFPADQASGQPGFPSDQSSGSGSEQVLGSDSTWPGFLPGSCSDQASGSGSGQPGPGGAPSDHVNITPEEVPLQSPEGSPGEEPKNTLGGGGTEGESGGIGAEGVTGEDPKNTSGGSGSDGGSGGSGLEGGSGGGGSESGSGGSGPEGSSGGSGPGGSGPEGLPAEDTEDPEKIPGQEAPKSAPGAGGLGALASFGSISGFLWVDGNGMKPTDWDGLYNGEEKPLAGYTVYLYAVGDLSAPLDSAETGLDGVYTFEGLEEGEYVLGLKSGMLGGAEYLLPMMMTADNKFAVDWGSVPLMAYTQPIQLEAGQDVAGQDAGMRLPMGIVPASGEFLVSGDMSGVYNTLSAAITAVNGNSGTNYTITVAKDETLNGVALVINSGKNVTIKSLASTIYTILTSNQIARPRHFEVSGALTLENIILDGRLLINDGIVDYDAGGIHVYSSGSLTLNNGAVIQNCQIRQIMSGVEQGGAVYLDGGSLTMNSGSKLCGNQVYKQGAIVNTAYAYGGAVFIGNNGDFTMNGGLISGNLADGTSNAGVYSHGAGVYLDSGTFTMNGGEISDNKVIGNTNGSIRAYCYGGGVYVNSGVFTMKAGALIKDNKFDSNRINFNFRGAAVFVFEGSFVMDGGEISSHIDADCLGTVFVQSDATFTMNGGVIKDNLCTTGGGVYAYGQFNMNGGLISGNTACGNLTTGTGGAIHTTSSIKSYNKIKIGPAAKFSGNKANHMVLPATDVSTIYPQFATSSSSLAAPYDHPLNNYDINCSFLEVTINCAQKTGGAAVPGAPGPVTLKVFSQGNLNLAPSLIPTVSGWAFTDWKLGPTGALQGNTNVYVKIAASLTSIYLLYEPAVDVTVYYRDDGDNPIGEPSQASYQVLPGGAFSLAAAQDIPLFEYIGWKNGAGGVLQGPGVPIYLPGVATNMDVYLIYQAGPIAGILDLSETTSGSAGYTVTGGATSPYSSGIYGGSEVPSPGRVLTFGAAADGKTYQIIQSGVRSAGAIQYDPDGAPKPKYGTSIYNNIVIGDGVTGVDVTLAIDDIDLIGYITVSNNSSLTLLLENTSYYASCAASYVEGGVIVTFLGGLIIDDAEESGACNGKLTVEATNADGFYDAAIGGYGGNGPSGVAENCGSIVINGGAVTAIAFPDPSGMYGGAAIGGGQYNNATLIDISGGLVTAVGYYGAGIGGGKNSRANAITISGGKVDAIGYQGAAIGSGHNGGANTGSITISGGEVTATKTLNVDIGGGGAGIGGGYLSTSGIITISGDDTKVTATGRSAGAGIGAGGETINTSSDIITISGGTIVAEGGLGAGIGSGGRTGPANVGGGIINISGGNVTATSFGYSTASDGDYGGAGIGGGGGGFGLPSMYGGGSGGTITISGGTIVASGNTGAGIGGANGGGTLIGTGDGSGGSITIKGSANVTATSRGGGAGIGGGAKGSAGTIKIEGGIVNASVEQSEPGRGYTGGTGVSVGGGAAIGAGGGYSNASGSNIAISGCIIYAENESDGAGIGGGCSGSGGPVTFSGSGTKVTANAKYGAGIGGGSGGEGGNIIMGGMDPNGVEISASSEYGAGIGGGGGSSSGVGGAGGIINIHDFSVGGLNGTKIFADSVIGAGIGGGGGDSSSAGGDGGTITIYGGNVTASSSGDPSALYGGAGIGGGGSLQGLGGDGGNITINNGAVTATGATGAGIGGGDGGDGGNITINNGVVTATGAAGAGLGGGGGGGGGSITLKGGKTSATGETGAGIGGGSSGAPASININDVANLWAYSSGEDKPAIDADGANAGGGYYVNASLEPAAISGTTPIDIYVFNDGYNGGDPEDRINTLTLPAGYRCFAYSSGQTSARQDNLYADLGTNPGFSDPDPDIRAIDRVEDSEKQIYSVHDLLTYYGNDHSGAPDGVLPVKLRLVHEAGAPSAENIEKYEAGLVSTGHALNGLSYLNGGFCYSDSLDAGGRPDDPKNLAWPEGSLDGMPASPKSMNTGSDPLAEPLAPNTRYYLITYLTAFTEDLWLTPPLDVNKCIESEVAEFVTKPGIVSGALADGTGPGDVKVSALFEGGEEALSAWVYWDTEPIDPEAPGTWEYLPHIFELDFGLGEFDFSGFEDYALSGLTNGANILIVIQNETGWDSCLLEYINEADVTVSKTLDGEYADRSRAFAFTLSLKDAGGPLEGSFDFTGGVVDPAGAATAPGGGTLELAGGEATFYLKDGQQITIEGLPAAAQINIAEAPDPGEFYIIWYEDSLDPGNPQIAGFDGSTGFSGVGKQARTFAFTNRQTNIVISGLFGLAGQIEPWMLLVALLLLAIAILGRRLQKVKVGRKEK